MERSVNHSELFLYQWWRFNSQMFQGPISVGYLTQQLSESGDKDDTNSTILISCLDRRLSTEIFCNWGCTIDSGTCFRCGELPMDRSEISVYFELSRASRLVPYVISFKIPCN
jgi:hypothetical protein